eukprot:COSAG01_NODE_8411_length_2794_cov_3.991095_1_plen_46_part_10
MAICWAEQPSSRGRPPRRLHECVKSAGVDDRQLLWDCLSFNSQPPP